MKIELRHVKRKQLTQYLETEFLKKERKQFQQYTALMANAAIKRSSSSASLSGGSGGGPIGAGGGGTTAIKIVPGPKRQRISESVSSFSNNGFKHA